MARRTLKTLLIAAAILVPVAAQAGWQDEASSFDQSRLARLDEARSRSRAEAGDVPAAHETFGAARARASLTGTWRCRTIKLGGMTPSLVYSWFRCRVTKQGKRCVSRKISGSQRMGGTLYPEGDGYGVSRRVLGEGRDAASLFRQWRIGGGACHARRPDRHAHHDVPWRDSRDALSVQESTLDVIELKR